MQTLKTFYQLPQISSHPPSIKWHTLPQLQKYIQNLNNPHIDQIAHLAYQSATKFVTEKA
jgi:hypothetical protein